MTDIEDFVTQYGEAYRTLISGALEFVRGREYWGLENFDEVAYIEQIISALDTIETDSIRKLES